MIVVMKPGADKQQVDHVVSLVREYGLKEHVIRGTDRTVVACIGDKRMVDKGAIESAPMVDRIVPIRIASSVYGRSTSGIALSKPGALMALRTSPPRSASTIC